MIRHRLHVLILFALGCAIAPQILAQSLVPDPSRTVKAALGGGGAAFEITSAMLNETRKINVALPASFASSSTERRYPVTVVLDGEAYLAPAAAVSDELTRHGLIPESIIVAIENTGPYRERVHDLTPPGLSVSGSSLNEGGDRFLDFIERELLPAIDRQFRGGLPRTLIGHSSGGILATYAAATRSTFQAVIAIDAPINLDQNWLARRMLEGASSSQRPLRFAYYEARFPWPEAEWEALVAAAPASWNLHKERLQREGHETAFMISAYLGLREVFGDYSRFAAPPYPTTRILPYYATLRTAFGAEVIPPQRILRNVVEDLLMEGRGAAAREAYDLLVFGYGAPENSAELLAQIAEVERQPPPTETVEGLLATPFPTPEEAHAYIGEWEGVMWRKSDQPRKDPTILRIEVVDGQVVAEIEFLDIPDEAYRFRRVEYLKVTPSGLSFGYMNGMRPRGVILYEGTLQGEALAGTSRWGGIHFTYPDFDGTGPPDPGFAFTRIRR